MFRPIQHNWYLCTRQAGGWGPASAGCPFGRRQRASAQLARTVKVTVAGPGPLFRELIASWCRCAFITDVDARFPVFNADRVPHLVNQLSNGGVLATHPTRQTAMVGFFVTLTSFADPRTFLSLVCIGKRSISCYSEVLFKFISPPFHILFTI